MVEAALYILTGLTLYGGGHYVYLGLKRPSAEPHFRTGGLYLLLAAFAFSSALTYQPPDLETLLPAGKVAVSLGIILWASLIWHIAFRTGFKPLLLLDVFTAVWAIFLVRNLSSANTLLYADVTPVQQTLLSGETVGLLFTRISPWWTAVELTMLASLLFCFYACYRLYQHGQPTLAVANIIGLALLGLVTLFDHFVSVQIIQTSYLMPFGFLFFLLAGSVYPWLQEWREKHAPRQAPVFNLTYMPDQASFHTDISQLHTPVTANLKTSEETEELTRKPMAKENRPVGRQATGSSVGDAGNKPATGTDTDAKAAAAQLDTATLQAISDNLIDIAVYATMALNRFRRGDADPQTLESLCKKIRSQSIKTRRMATRLVPPEQTEDGRENG
jgi:hypothetical protein